MLFLIKKILFTITLNIGLLFILIMGIQNSSQRSKINVLVGETVNLPIGFIIGISFISGSISGSLLTIDFKSKRKAP
tara:strand:+ start:615 stop:845 length:231 start_codon:yes stop_codon:yes gene_type:complete